MPIEFKKSDDGTTYAHLYQINDHDQEVSRKKAKNETMRRILEITITEIEEKFKKRRYEWQAHRNGKNAPQWAIGPQNENVNDLANTRLLWCFPYKQNSVAFYLGSQYKKEIVDNENFKINENNEMMGKLYGHPVKEIQIDGNPWILISMKEDHNVQICTKFICDIFDN